MKKGGGGQGEEGTGRNVFANIFLSKFTDYVARTKTAKPHTVRTYVFWKAFKKLVADSEFLLLLQKREKITKYLGTLSY